MCELPIFQHQILLASSSPRRKELLENAGFQIRVLPVDIEEIYPSDLPVLQVPEFLSQQKSQAALPFREKSEIILAADSIVLHSGQVLGKPSNIEAARQMLRRLSNDIHQVITGVTLQNHIRVCSFSVSSTVHFYPLDEEEINFYISQYHPFDKAGGYGIQDWIGWCKVRRLEGSYTNVMGLPVAALYESLIDHF